MTQHGQCLPRLNLNSGELVDRNAGKEAVENQLTHGLRERNRHGITDLTGYGHLGAAPEEVVGESLEARCFEMGDRPVGFGV